MTDEKELSKEALGVAFHITETKPPHSYVARIARALDAWGEALLRRQADHACCKVERDAANESLVECFDRLTAEKAAHAATRAELERELEAYRALAAHYSSACAELEATKVELADKTDVIATHEALLIEEKEARDKARKQCYIAALEIESLRKPLEGELAEDVTTVSRQLGGPGATYEAVLAARAALDRIEAALRAKGRELAAALDNLQDTAIESEKSLRVARSYEARWRAEVADHNALRAKGDLLEEWELFGATITGCTNHSGKIALEDAREQLETHIRVAAELRAKGEPQASDPLRRRESPLVVIGPDRAEPPEPRCSCRSAPMGSTFCGDCKHDRGCPVHNSDRCKTRGRAQAAPEARPIDADTDDWSRETQAAELPFRIEYEGHMVNERGEQVPAGGLLAGRMTGEPPEPRGYTMTGMTLTGPVGPAPLPRNAEPTLLRCEHGVLVSQPCEVCGENSVQRCSAYCAARSVTRMSDPGPIAPAPEIPRKVEPGGAG